MSSQLSLTITAMNKLTEAQQTGQNVAIREFAVTDSPVSDQETYGNEIYRNLITDITADEENDNTIKILATIPPLENITGIISKAYLYDDDGDVFAYGLIPSIELVNDTSLEIELEFFLTFSNTSYVELAAPIESFVDTQTFEDHNHNDLYYQKIEVNNLLNQKSDQDHNHDDIYYLKTQIDTQIAALSSRLDQVMSSLEPIGHIGMFYSTVAPNNYLKLNGSWWSKETYQDLWQALQNQPSLEESDDTLYFRLLDMRGVFPRFIDDGRGLDNDRSVGSYQADMLKQHYHGYSRAVGWINGPAASNIKYPGGASMGDGSKNTSFTGGVETRPKNIALLACIKYRLF